MGPVVVPPLRQPPIAFAHRGARAHAPENTMEAFRLALRLGATGLESDAWITADGEVVLDHDGAVRRGWRKRALADLSRRELPDHIPTLAELYDDLGTGFELSLDVKDADAAPAILAIAREAGTDAVARLWLCHPSWTLVADWRSLSDDVRLVDSTRLARISEGPERRVANLADVGIDALNLHWTDWSAGLTTLVHKFHRYALGWDAQHDRALHRLLRMGIDGLYSDHVDRMVEALARGDRSGPGVRGT